MRSVAKLWSKFLVTSSSLFCFLLLAILGTAQTPISQIDPATALALANIRKALSASTSSPPPISVTGQIDYVSGAPSQPITIDAVSPDNYKVQVGIGDTAYTWIASSGNASVQSDGATRKRPFANSFAERCALIPIQGLVFDKTFTKASGSGAPIGTSKSPLNVFVTFEYHLPVMNDQDFVMLKQLEVDPTTFLPVRLVEFSSNDGDPNVASQVEYGFENYGPEGNFIVPHTISIHVDSQPQSVITLKTFTPNPGLVINALGGN